MSIFSKICPRCAGDNPVDVTHCQCGFVFEASATTGSYRALEMAEQEALVYAEYLQARMNQAKEAAEVAINDQARSPGNDAKSSAAKASNEEFLETKAEYDEQMKLVLELRKEARNAQAVEQKEQESVWQKAKQRAKQKAIKAEQEALAVKQKIEKEAAKKRKIQQQAKRKAESAAKAAAEKLAVRQSGRKSPPPILKEKMANDADAAATRVRQAQPSIKKGMAAATSAINKKDTRTTAPSAGNNNPAQRKHQSNKNKTVSSKTTLIQTKTKVAKNQNEKDCPNCTAIVPINSKTCKCGYGFPQGAEQMDGIGLSEEDSASLLSMFQPGGNT